MKTIHLGRISVVVLGIFIASCASTGMNLSSHLTNVELNRNNFNLVARSVSGQASIQGILGGSFGFGAGASQMALIPISENRLLYKTAMENLWSSFEAANGASKGRKLALTNVRYDSESLNTIVYTKLTVVIVADVVEFVE